MAKGHLAALLPGCAFATRSSFPFSRKEERVDETATYMRGSTKLRLLSWNVAGRAGPSKDLQFAEVLKLAPDAVALQEVVRGSLPSWRDHLHANGYVVLSSEVELLDVEGPFLPIGATGWAGAGTST